MYCFTDEDTHRGLYEVRALATSQYEHIVVEWGAERTTIQLLNGRLYDYRDATAMGAELLEFIRLERPRQLIVDFSRVVHLSKESVNSLLRANMLLAASGGRMKLAALNYAVRDVLRILNLDGTVFDIYATREEAEAAF